MAKTILIVDDDPDILESLGDLVQLKLGMSAVTAPSGPEGLQILRRQAVDAVVSDFRMPGMNGCAFLHQAQELRPHLPAILISAFQNVILAEDGCDGVELAGFLAKPVDPLAFETLLASAMGA